MEIGILENTLIGSIAARTALADYPDVVRVLDEGMPSLDGLASFTIPTWRDPASTAFPPAAFVSPNYFDVLGVRPEIGRTFAPGERLNLRSRSSVARCGCGNSAGTLQ